MPPKCAYITLLTRPSYLAGAVLLAHSLKKNCPNNTPLIIAYTPSTLPEPCVEALRLEAQYSNIILHAVEHLRLPESKEGAKEAGSGMVAERFADTWTKLRVFDVCLDDGYEMICWLDADMIILKDVDTWVFNPRNLAYLTGNDKAIQNGQDADTPSCKLLATHTCVCNLDHDPWAPSSWTPFNCAFTHLSSPAAIAPVHGTETFANFNSGTFVFRPSVQLSRFVASLFRATPLHVLQSMAFPDQDFLNLAFSGRWEALSWRTNALKTWRYWHTNIWRDDEVAVLHYIVDKPWAARIRDDGSAGYLGKDGVTHGWWWNVYEQWCKERSECGEAELLATVLRHVAGENGVQSEDFRAIGGGVQGFAIKWSGKGEGESVVKA